jgi:single-stranded DNA-binding protein
MRSDATAFIVGYLGADPEVSTPKPGQSVMNMTVAVRRGYGKTAVTLWIKVELWNPAKPLLERLAKGSYVRVVGSLFPTSWFGKDGGQRTGFVVRYPQVLILADAKGAKLELEDGEPDF